MTSALTGIEYDPQAPQSTKANLKPHFATPHSPLNPTKAPEIKDDDDRAVVSKLHGLSIGLASDPRACSPSENPSDCLAAGINRITLNPIDGTESTETILPYDQPCLRLSAEQLLQVDSLEVEGGSSPPRAVTPETADRHSEEEESKRNGETSRVEAWTTTLATSLASDNQDALYDTQNPDTIEIDPQPITLDVAATPPVQILPPTPLLSTFSPPQVPIQDRSSTSSPSGPRTPRRSLVDRSETAEQAGLLVFPDSTTETIVRKVRACSGSTVPAGSPVLDCDIKHLTLHSELCLTHCYGCFAATVNYPPVKANTFLPCGGCNMVLFCSVRCYARNANAHRAECRVLEETSMMPSAEARLIVKACIERLAKPETSLRKYPLVICSAEVKQFLEELSDEVIVFLSHMSFAPRMQKLVDRLLKREDDLLFHIRQIQCEMFPVPNKLGSTIGWCISDKAALFGHGCDPNAHIVFPFRLDDPRPMRILRNDTKMAAGEEIRVSYCEPTLLCNVRSNVLSLRGFSHVETAAERPDDCQWRCTIAHPDYQEPTDYKYEREPIGTLEPDPINPTKCSRYYRMMPHGEIDALVQHVLRHTGVETDAVKGDELLPIVTDVFDIEVVRAEVASLQKAITRTKHFEPDEFPLPQLQYRLQVRRLQEVKWRLQDPSQLDTRPHTIGTVHLHDAWSKVELPTVICGAHLRFERAVLLFDVITKRLAQIINRADEANALLDLKYSQPYQENQQVIQPVDPDDDDDEDQMTEGQDVLKSSRRFLTKSFRREEQWIKAQAADLEAERRILARANRIPPLDENITAGVQELGEALLDAYRWYGKDADVTRDIETTLDDAMEKERWSWMKSKGRARLRIEY